MNNKYFKTAFMKTKEIEGGEKLTNDMYDPGGETFCGISKVYWPEWEGWKVLKGAKGNISELVESFYRVNFWHRIQGDKLSEMSPALAYEVFDTAVNIGVSKAIEFLQEGHNVGSGQAYPLVVDGLLGVKTLETVKRYLSIQPGSPALNEEILLNCMNGEQYLYYKANPNHKRYRGWFRRV